MPIYELFKNVSDNSINKKYINMPRAILIKDRNNERDYKIPNGRIITL